MQLAIRILPMEKIFLSIALVQITHNGRTKWLLDERPDGLGFIAGDRLERESFRETVIREVAWQLDLDRTKDFIVSNMAQISVEFVEAKPHEFHEQHFALAFYNVYLSKRDVIVKLTEDPSKAWVTAAEICAGTSSDGRRIQSDVVSWINKYEVVRPWQV